MVKAYAKLIYNYYKENNKSQFASFSDLNFGKYKKAVFHLTGLNSFVKFVSKNVNKKNKEYEEIGKGISLI